MASMKIVSKVAMGEGELEMTTELSVNEISRCIYHVRGQQVMLDSDLAKFYEVTPKRLNQQVRRNADRFPPDFMFELAPEEYDSLKLQIATLNTENLRSQIATLNIGNRNHRKYIPLVFTEQGVTMASAVLKSKRAVALNIAIVRAFVQLRQTSGTKVDLTHKLERLEEKFDDLKYEYVRQTKVLLDAMHKMAIEMSHYRPSNSKFLAAAPLTLGDGANDPASLTMTDVNNIQPEDGDFSKGLLNTFDTISKAVARHYGLSIQDLRSLSRTKTVTLPRQIAMYLTRNQSSSSLREIGIYFKGKDHTTVLHACRKIEAAIGHDMKIRNAVRSIQSIFE